MSNNSRENILSAIRDNLPEQKVEHPHIPTFRRPVGALKAVFEEHLKAAGGTAHDLGSVAEAKAKLMALHPEAKVVCSAVPEIAGTRRVETVNDPHDSRMWMWVWYARNSGLRRVAPFGSHRKT